ncbi:tRNA-specific 2-thiouridylase [Candidatus Jorgensenbacteria bacterium]|nr:tRNA-specific 2-thiouridylase [Candidatus Jorgensenbacteria bacterium]
MSTLSNKKVFVAMSGGVDSSVTALLLKNQGYDVSGVFMRCFNIDGCAERDALDARRVAEHLGIPFYTFDFEEEYKKEVVGYMIDGYRRGITPNPDVMCNKHIKFGLFLKKARELGADYIATGHYVRLVSLSQHRLSTRSGGEPQSALSAPRSTEGGTKLAMPARAAAQKKLASFGLYEAKDKNKDQSYFLWTLTQEQLKYCFFPIGDYLKSEVRDIARKAGLPTAEKKDSQGICFLGKVALDEFLKGYIPSRRGEVVTVNGERIGEHEGAWYYTIGQRHGLNLDDKNRLLKVKGKEETQAHYVAIKDIATNTVVVAGGNNHPSLFRESIKISEANFINPNIKMPDTIWVRIRYRQPLVLAKFMQLDSSIYQLIFAKPQKFVAPGQSAVFYSKDRELLGGGIIL